MFWGFRRGKFFDLEVETPRKSIPTGTRRLMQNGGDTPKNVFSRAAQEITKKIKKVKKTFEHGISPHCRGAPAGPIVIFACWVAPTT